MQVLSASNIQKRFGGVVALSKGEFALDEGEVHVLVGSNGCGKSTLCKIIAGSVAPDAGRLEVAGRGVVFASPHAAADASIRVFYQEHSLIPQLTVAENVFLGSDRKSVVEGNSVSERV